MKWEYLVFNQLKNLEKREFAFNHLGDKGWELVTADNGTVYFKRPIYQIRAEVQSENIVIRDLGEVEA